MLFSQFNRELMFYLFLHNILTWITFLYIERECLCVRKWVRVIKISDVTAILRNCRSTRIVDKDAAHTETEIKNLNIHNVPKPIVII